MCAENKPKKELIRMLQQMGYDSDPVKAWKQAQEKVGHSDSSGFQVQQRGMQNNQLCSLLD